MTRFKVHGAKQLPSGPIVTVGFVDGPRLEKGQRGQTTLMEVAFQASIDALHHYLR